MKTALIAAVAALSATAWVATPAYAQRDRGEHSDDGGHGQAEDQPDESLRFHDFPLQNVWLPGVIQVLLPVGNLCK